METKECSNCHNILPISKFCKDKSRKDNLNCYCKQCASTKWYKYYNKDVEKKRKRQWYLRNKEKIKNTKKKYNNSIALYNTFSYQLTVDEEPRLANDGASLEIRCRYCGKYYKPITKSVIHRIECIKTNKGEGNLYCSEGCKYSCSTYRQQLYPKDYKPATSREEQPALRKLVFKRDNWTCQKCDNTEQLHCHHIDPVADNPIESADIDNCITFCVECHKEVHQQNGCRYNELTNC